MDKDIAKIYSYIKSSVLDSTESTFRHQLIIRNKFTLTHNVSYKYYKKNIIDLITKSTVKRRDLCRLGNFR